MDDFLSTAGEWIALVASGARAHRNVIDDDAFGVRATHSGAWIAAMLSNASHAAGAVAVVHALRSATGRVWIANVRRDARALRETVLDDAL